MVCGGCGRRPAPPSPKGLASWVGQRGFSEAAVSLPCPGSVLPLVGRTVLLCCSLLCRQHLAPAIRGASGASRLSLGCLRPSSGFLSSSQRPLGSPLLVTVQATGVQSIREVHPFPFQGGRLVVHTTWQDGVSVWRLARGRVSMVAAQPAVGSLTISEHKRVRFGSLTYFYENMSSQATPEPV